MIPTRGWCIKYHSGWYAVWRLKYFSDFNYLTLESETNEYDVLALGETKEYVLLGETDDSEMVRVNNP